MKILLLCVLALASFLPLCTSNIFTSIYSRFYETCDSTWVPGDMGKFRDLFGEKVFGQPLVESLVASAVSGHFRGNPKKALVLSFHGWPGIGKNLVSSLLVESIFKEGTKSAYYKHYNARIDFTLESEVPRYRQKLIEDVKNQLQRCERSVFIFDEIDMMPKKLIDAIYPFIDFQHTVDGVDPRKAIFIFLSNKGGTDIATISFNLWKEGRGRQTFKIQEFSGSLTKAAFNEAGGLQFADNINGNLVNYFVPFLPLQLEHVKQCIAAELKELQYAGSNIEIVEEVLPLIGFTSQDSPSGGLFAVSGCKNVDSYVATAVERLFYHSGRKGEL